MNAMPLITAIVPVYNTQKYLTKCLDSLINQTYRNLQIVLIDDGSTDNSPIICDSYANRDSRVTVIHKDNQGVSSARNLGIDLSTGDYISFIDSDDWLELDAYEHLVACIAAHHADAVIFEYFIIYENGVTVHKAHSNLNGLMDKLTAIETTISPVNRFAVSKIYARKLIEDVRFDQGIHIGEDTLFACYALNNTTSVYYTAKPLYHYLQSEISATRCTFNKKRFTGVEAYQRLVEFCATYHPTIVGVALASYINLIILIVTDLCGNLDYPDARKHIRSLTREVQKYFVRILFSGQASTKLKIKLVLFCISPWLPCEIHKRHGTLCNPGS